VAVGYLGLLIDGHGQARARVWHDAAGLVFIGAGMSVWGILAVRTNALGWLSFAPLPIGVLGLAGITFLSPHTFARLESSVVPLAFSAGWIVLGLALLTSPPQSPQRVGRDTSD